MADLKVAFQGEPGAYSEAAVLDHYGFPVEAIPCESFELVFAAVTEGNCDAGFIPIENSLAGSIHRNYDLLIQHDVSVIGEHYLQVRHCLIALPGSVLPEIRRVISHPQALAQCEAYIRSLPGIKAEPVYDTAGSVKMARQSGDRSVAAIASRRAAELYGMSILAEDIQDNPANFTRFLIIAPRPAAPYQETNPAGHSAKTSIVFTLKNEPGSLFKALSVFALRDIDLTKIESRPLVGKPWEYLFYIDFLGSTEEARVSRALAHLTEYAISLRVLGSYPRHQRNNHSMV